MVVTVLVMRGESEKRRQEHTFLPMTCIHDILVLPCPVKLVSLVQLLLVALTELQLLSVVGKVIIHGGVHIVTLPTLAVTQLGEWSVRIVQRV